LGSAALNDVNAVYRWLQFSGWFGRFVTLLMKHVENLLCCEELLQHWDFCACVSAHTSYLLVDRGTHSHLGYAVSVGQNWL